MSTLYQNFNFNPVETSTKTSDYTIPNDRYARAIISQSGQQLLIGSFGGTESRNIAPSFILLNNQNIDFSSISYQTSSNTSSTHTLLFNEVIPSFCFYLNTTMSTGGSPANIQVLIDATWTTVISFANLRISRVLGPHLRYEYQNVGGIRSTGTQFDTNQFTLTQGERTGILNGEPFWLKPGDSLTIRNMSVRLEEFNVLGNDTFN
jgi:hypothetical protein